jgi:putative ABC transport system permease protein
MIAWRSLQQRGVSSFLTGLSMALGVMLMVAVLSAGKTVRQAYETGPSLNHDLVIGPKGSSLALVLNTEFHIDKTLPSTLPWTYYEEFLGQDQRADKLEGRFAKFTELAVPICKGDSYEGFHVVGTTPDFFETPAQLPEPLFYLAAGEIFGPREYFAAVLGAAVAEQTGLQVGDSFEPTHGVEPTGGDEHKHEAVKVVGILSPSGTPNDRAIFMNIEGFLMLHHEQEQKGLAGSEHARGQEHDPAHAHNHDHAHDHAHDHGHDHAQRHEPLPKEQKSVSAILVRTKTLELLSPVDNQPIKVSGNAAQALVPLINQDTVAQAVSPILVTQEFSQKFVQPFITILAVMTGLILISSAVSILVGIYNSMQERRHEIGVLRALGASQQTVMLLMFIETILLALIGGAVGWILGHLLIGMAGPLLTPRTGISFDLLQISPWEWILIPALILLAGVVGYLPAMAAYRTDVAKALSATP